MCDLLLKKELVYTHFLLICFLIKWTNTTPMCTVKREGRKRQFEVVLSCCQIGFTCVI